ncbi:dNA polymerase [Firmicutes bacterium CAG:95]|jgi:DNA polymerase-1|nr:dNA polymerase [Firmicutes bacterium CAG:95]
MSKLVLIDGHSILNRAFYGVPDLTNAAGLHTNAIYGFLNILFKILDEESPDYLTVAFDVKAPTFRHEMFKEYKGTRKPMPEELREQVPVMKEVLQAMGIRIIEQAGYEADDLLGTIAKRAEAEGIDVSLVSGDRDLLQIATDRIRIRIPKTKGGRTEIENYYAADVEAKYQVNPVQFIDLKALMGDTADNIPGVPKVGEKTATDLMVQFGSLDGIYEHIDEVTKKSVKESLIQNKDLAYLSRELATIKLDSPLTYTLEEARVGNFFNEASYILFKKLEFKNLLNKFEKGVSNEEISASFHLVENLAEVEALFTRVLSDKDRQIGLKVVKEAGRHGELLGVALHLQEEGSFLVLKQGFLTEDYLKEKIALLGAQCRIATADIKSEYAYLQAQDTDRFFDVILAAYLLNPLKNDYTVEDIANEYLNLMLPEKGQAFGRLSFKDALNEKPEDFLKYCCFEAYVCAQAAVCLQQKLEETQMDRLMREIEMPLTLVLFSMEEEGIRVNPEALKDYGEALSGKITELEQEIYSEAGCEFNINSPKQLGEILFEKMGLPGGKKTKTGYSTAADVLEKLSGEYPVVKHILEYRGLTKLKSTYADGLAAYIEDENRIHSTFNQTITATGRISSTEPNLQNIPIRMELGRQIRKVFIPKDGYCFMDADYSQIELRVLASMSGDERLIEAYRSHADIHRTTASQVFHIPFEEVTDLQRRNAKAVNFGIVYGISSFGLSEDLSISRKEAAAYIEQYFETYPQVKQFIDSLVKDAKKNGYAVTLYGRRRPVPELFSSNFMQRSFGERVAMNSPIQGTAADIIKIAMIRVFERLKKEGLKSKLILQVHDELLIETALEEEEQVRMILEEEMVHASSLAVELEIDLHVGINWYEAK